MSEAPSDAAAAGALSGFTILDCTRLLPGEYGTQLLADLGARIIKVEIPQAGEYGRQRPYFGVINRRKLSITVNLRTARGVSVFKRLAGQADAVFESFRPGVMKRLGIDYESVRSVQPGIVFCSLTGFGQDGPYRNRPAHDINYQALAGSLKRTAGAAPGVPGSPAVDMAAGMMSALTIVAAVHSARTTGQGQHIDIAMSDVALSLNLFNVSMIGVPSANRAAQPGDGTPGDHAFGFYETKDGRYVAVANLEQRFWEEFVCEMGLPHLADRLGAEGDESRAIRGEIQAVFRTGTLAEWEGRFAERDVCVTPVLRVDEAVKNPQNRARDVVWRDEYGWGAAFPAQFSRTPALRGGPVPAPGEHADAILRQIGYSSDDINVLRADQII